MNIQEIVEWYKRINYLLDKGRVLDAFDKIASAMPKGSYSIINEQLDELRFTYTNLLKYKVQGIEDPQSKEIYNSLIINTYELADQLKLELINQPGYRIASIKHDLEKQMQLNNEDLAGNLLGLSFDYELNEMLRSTALYEDESESESAAKHRKAIQRAFNFLWLNNRFSEDDTKVVGQIFESNSFPWYEKSLLVSSLTLGLVRTFDLRRIELLIKLYAHSNPQVSIRALVGILIAFCLYDKRISLVPKFSVILQLLKDDESFELDVLTIIKQIMRAKDTDRITRKFRDEIVPEIIRFNEDLSEKLNLEKLLQSDEEADKNPDWEKYFDNQPDLVRKLEDLTNMQMEGNDVFLGAFSMLKNFGFFNDIHHWFMPFYREHFAIVAALRNENENTREIFLKGIENSPYMCNSDKFSFILNLSIMPEGQKEMMAQMLSGEAEQFEELINEELADPALRKKRIAIQYIQDLYRFFKLNSIKTETGDVFSYPLEVYNTRTLTGLVVSPIFYKSIAAFCFDLDHFNEAYNIYQKLMDMGENYAELYEKSGYCLQQEGLYDNAIAMYQKADLFDTNRKWLLGKMAHCYLKSLQRKEAFDIYLELSRMEPDNIKYLAAAGTCCLNMGDTAKALEYFYRIDFIEPGTAKSMRPVAWCLFTLGRLDEADNYYNQLLGMEPNAFDYMNAGHVSFCQGNRQKATDYYVQSIFKRSGDQRTFLKAFIEDRKFLMQNGVNENDIPLMLDFVRIRYQNESGQA
ncbi:MAG: tetratricopeptide repeat protein [Bacteroidota bacterium]